MEALSCALIEYDSRPCRKRKLKAERSPRNGCTRGGNWGPEEGVVCTSGSKAWGEPTPSTLWSWMSSLWSCKKTDVCPSSFWGCAILSWQPQHTNKQALHWKPERTGTSSWALLQHRQTLTCQRGNGKLQTPNYNTLDTSLTLPTRSS